MAMAIAAAKNPRHRILVWLKIWPVNALNVLICLSIRKDASFARDAGIPNVKKPVTVYNEEES